MELVTAFTTRLHQVGFFKHRQVLRYGLSRRSQLVLRREASTDLEECLLIAFGQLVKDHAPRVIRDGLVHIAHDRTLGKSLLACQGERARRVAREVALVVERSPSATGI